MSIPKLNSYPLTNTLEGVTNKAPWNVDPEKAILLIHDMQNYFVDFYDQSGQLMPEVINNIVALKKWCQSLSIDVYYTAQPGDQDQIERALLIDFWGKGLDSKDNKPEIIEQLKPTDKDTVLRKWRYSAFKKSPLLEMMQKNNKDQIIICGIYAHIGVLATSLDAFMLDIKPIVISDCVADFSEQEHKMAMQYISKRCGSVYNLAQLQSQITEDSKKESFKKESLKNESTNKESQLTLDALVQDVAKILSVDSNEVEVDEEFMYLGLDSVRMMSLIEIWNQRGWSGEFSQLAQATTLNELFLVLSQGLMEHSQVNTNSVESA